MLLFYFVYRVLIKRGADFNIDDIMKMRPDELALKHGAREAADLIELYRHERAEKIKEQVEDVSANYCDASHLFLLLFIWQCR